MPIADALLATGESSCGAGEPAMAGAGALPTSVRLPLMAIRTDGGTQPRATLNADALTDYTEAMRQGVTFPPITVFHDGAAYWLADGFHRLAAARQTGATEIAADVRQGTLDAARWYSYSVNQTHGLRRAGDDKRRAVEASQRHSYADRSSNREIARHCGVDEHMIRTYRDAICGNSADTPRIVTRNGTTYTMQTTPIGARRRRQVDAPAPAHASIHDALSDTPHTPMRGTPQRRPRDTHHQRDGMPPLPPSAGDQAGALVTAGWEAAMDATDLDEPIHAALPAAAWAWDTPTTLTDIERRAAHYGLLVDPHPDGVILRWPEEDPTKLAVLSLDEAGAWLDEQADDLAAHRAARAAKAVALPDDYLNLARAVLDTNSAPQATLPPTPHGPSILAPEADDVQRIVDQLLTAVASGAVPAAVVFLPAATTAPWFHALAERATLCFVRADMDASAGGLIAYLDPNTARFAAVFGALGAVLQSMAQRA
jgi:hypothetical protein